jgi:hypothetical protein
MWGFGASLILDTGGIPRLRENDGEILVTASSMSKKAQQKFGNTL